jgi:glycerol-3-phosphate dehydrogenase
MNLSSSKNRSNLILALTSTTFDLIVIGGGITGAGIALDAASRGLKVALLEKKDFASGTSSKSTKLIHGGLRYLKQLEIGLVRETGTERAIVHRLAPHLVVPEKMLLPLVEKGTYGKLGTSIGLAVYDFLAEVSSADRRKMLSREETLAKEPLLKQDGILGGGFYAEYRTDDARLTIEIIKKAIEFGANCINYVEVHDFSYDESGKINGVIANDLIDQQALDINASFIVNATGPWVDQLRKQDNSLKGKRLFLSKGVHIVVPHERLPIKQSVYFDVPDGRMVFAIPRHRTTYIGTTDTPYEESIDQVLTQQEDVDYLLQAANSMFPDVHLSNEDVESSWAGLRPLIYEEGKSASQMSRKDEIFESESGLISIAGGKLTGYRKMAERIVNLVIKKHPNKEEFKTCYTNKIPLAGGHFKTSKDVADYKVEIEKKVVQKQLAEYYAIYLVSNYGKQTDEILAKMNDFEGNSEEKLIRAELWFTLQQEMVHTPLDFFNRRTGRVYFNLPSILRLSTVVLQDIQAYFNWSDEKAKLEEELLQMELQEVSEFDFAVR